MRLATTAPVVGAFLLCDQRGFLKIGSVFEPHGVLLPHRARLGSLAHPHSPQTPSCALPKAPVRLFRVATAPKPQRHTGGPSAGQDCTCEKCRRSTDRPHQGRVCEPYGGRISPHHSQMACATGEYEASGISPDHRHSKCDGAVARRQRPGELQMTSDRRAWPCTRSSARMARSSANAPLVNVSAA